jgi:hypothetical protein
VSACRIFSRFAACCERLQAFLSYELAPLEANNQLKTLLALSPRSML